MFKAAIETFLLKFPYVLLPFFATLVFGIFHHFNFDFITWTILGVAFVVIGLSHGALDHLTQYKMISKAEFIHFILSYLFKSGLLALVWFFIPDLAFFIFLAYSAWHFGQADFKEWKLKQNWLSVVWGSAVLMAILLFHKQEMVHFLQQISGLRVANYLNSLSPNLLLYTQIATIFLGLMVFAFTKSKHILITLTYILVSIYLPLLISFGIYFIFQHSIYGWRQLRIGFQKSFLSLWLQSIPFTIASVIFLFVLLLFTKENQLGLFFVILSCLSVPHVVSIYKFYAKLA